MAYLTNGTLNYDLTKDAACCEQQLAYIEDRNKMDPTYPDPNDSRFTDPAPVFTILNNLLYRDGNSVGRIYNNKTGKLIDITDTLGTNITAKDTEDSATRLDVPIPTVEKLTGTKFTIEDPYNGHEYVEIGGLKWATMNIGANSVTDYGLYFQWGDTQGYTAAQVGSGSGQKYFGWGDYKYSNNGGSTAADMTKYNSTDEKTTLDASDDAATAAWGGNWRMPTTAELQALSATVNTEWTANYQGSGVAGLICTDKVDSSKVLFFPANGYCYNGSAQSVGVYGYYWSSSLNTGKKLNACYLYFQHGSTTWNSFTGRLFGFAVRPVIG